MPAYSTCAQCHCVVSPLPSTMTAMNAALILPNAMPMAFNGEPLSTGGPAPSLRATQGLQKKGWRNPSSSHPHVVGGPMKQCPVAEEGLELRFQCQGSFECLRPLPMCWVSVVGHRLDASRITIANRFRLLCSITTWTRKAKVRSRSLGPTNLRSMPLAATFVALPSPTTVPVHVGCPFTGLCCTPQLGGNAAKAAKDGAGAKPADDCGKDAFEDCGTDADRAQVTSRSKPSPILRETATCTMGPPGGPLIA